MDKPMKRKTSYKDCVWLNRNDSPSTGSVVCYDGIVEYTEGDYPTTFIEFADCQQKVRLHRTHTDTPEEFIEKVDKIIKALTRFESYLIIANRENSDNDR